MINEKQTEFAIQIEKRKKWTCKFNFELKNEFAISFFVFALSLKDKHEFPTFYGNSKNENWKKDLQLIFNILYKLPNWMAEKYTDPGCDAAASADTAGERAIARWSLCYS